MEGRLNVLRGYHSNITTTSGASVADLAIQVRSREAAYLLNK